MFDYTIRTKTLKRRKLKHRRSTGTRKTHEITTPWVEFTLPVLETTTTTAAHTQTHVNTSNGRVHTHTHARARTRYLSFSRYLCLEEIHRGKQNASCKVRRAGRTKNKKNVRHLNEMYNERLRSIANTEDRTVTGSEKKSKIGSINKI